MKLVYTGRWWVDCYIWYSEEGTGRGRRPSRPLLAVPNITAHPSTASVPIAVLVYYGPLLCGFNVPVKGLKIRNYNSIICTALQGRDVHGNGIPSGTGNPIGNGNKTQNWEWEGMGNHLSWNGNYLQSHGNLFPKVLCCDKLLLSYSTILARCHCLLCQVCWLSSNWLSKRVIEFHFWKQKVC